MARLFLRSIRCRSTRAHDDRVVFDAQLIDLVQERFKITVDLLNAIADLTALGGVLVLFPWAGREVKQRVIEVDKERFAL